jgi:hypothetical protein
LNPIENVWAETKSVMAENWPDPSSAFKNALWDVVLDAWKEVAHSEGYAATLVESLPRRMQMVIDSEGYCHIEWLQSNSPFKGYVKVQNS